MRILLLHSRYQSGSASGENRVVDDELTLLRGAGHEVHAWQPTVSDLREPVTLRAGFRLVTSPAARHKVRDLIEDLQPDVVHVHNLFPMLSPSIINVIDEVSCPSVMTLHNYRLSCLPATHHREGRICELCCGRIPWNGVRYKCYQSSRIASAALTASLSFHRSTGAFGNVSLFLAISHFVQDHHVRCGTVERSNCEVKPHFAFPVKARAQIGDYFVFAGRLSAEKGVDNLISMWRGSVTSELVVVGDGPLKERLQVDAKGHPISFRATLAPDDLATLIRGSRALLVPSTCYEGAGKIVLEAYAAGVPVIVSRIGGLPEIVRHEETGLLVDPFDPEDWAGAVRRLEDDQESMRMGLGGHELWAREYTPTVGLHNLERYYRQAIESGHRR